MRFFRRSAPPCLALALFVGAAGCATPRASRDPRPPAPGPATRAGIPERSQRNEAREAPRRAPSCRGFESEIRSCAKLSGHAELADLLYGIARCETGRTCDSGIDSPTGRYRGAFQFLPQTWERQCVPVFARHGLADCLGGGAIHDACCATVCAAEMVAAHGTRDWPACGRRARRELARRRAKRHAHFSG